MIIDTETTGSLEQPLCYDIAYAIMDNNGAIVLTRRYLVREVFFGMRDAMQSAYYAEKLPQYYEAMQCGLTDETLANIYTEIKRVCNEYNITQVWAFNAAFDRNALNYTIETVSNGFVKWFMPYGVEWKCIQAYATQTILNSRNYFKYAVSHGLVSESRNVRTTAEAAYRYISRDDAFIEAHTALEDVLIECQILHKCLRQHRKVDPRPSRSAWRACQPKFKQYLASIA